MKIKIVQAEFDLQTSWFLHATEGISDAESNSKALEHFNSIKWVAGHVIDTRMTLISLLTNESVNENYKSLFGKGTSGIVDSSFPTIEELRTEWILISDKLSSSLQKLTDEQISSKAPFQTSIPDDTLHGLIAYFAIHESFHLGQLSVYRKLTGKPAMNMGKITKLS